MPTPNFSLSLDEFPGLLDGPIESGTFLGETVVNALQEALEPYQSRHRTLYIVSVANELRHRFIEMGDERSSMAFADIIFAYSPGDDYTLNIVSGWVPEDNPEKFVRALLSQAAKFRYLPSLYSSCLQKASAICHRAGLQGVAHQLLVLRGSFSLPGYQELNWLSGSSTNLVVQSLVPSSQTSKPAPSSFRRNLQMRCPRCHSENLVRDGRTENGSQRYKCHQCGKRSRESTLLAS